MKPREDNRGGIQNSSCRGRGKTRRWERERDDHGIIRKSRFYHDGGVVEERTKRVERVGCEAWMLDDHRRERKKGAGKRAGKSERERVKQRERRRTWPYVRSGDNLPACRYVWRIRGTCRSSGLTRSGVLSAPTCALTHPRIARCTPHVRLLAAAKTRQLFNHPDRSILLGCFSFENRYDKSGRDGLFLAEEDYSSEAEIPASWY